MFLKKSRKTIHFENFIFNYQFKSVFNSLLETSSGWLGRTKEILPRRRHFGTFVTQTALNTPRKEQKKTRYKDREGMPEKELNSGMRKLKLTIESCILLGYLYKRNGQQRTCLSNSRSGWRLSLTSRMCKISKLDNCIY